MTSELGKAKFIGNEKLNVSWTLFSHQSTGKVYYSQTDKITSSTTSVSFTTKNYTVLTGLEIGEYYILVQNGTTFPSSTSTTFTGTIPVSSVLETFTVTYVGSNIFNVTWKAFNKQSSVSIYYAIGNASDITDKSSYSQVLTADHALIEVTGTLKATSSVTFLVVNGSAFPTGQVKLSSYAVVVTGFSALHGGYFMFYGIGLGFFGTMYGIILEVGIAGAVIGGVFYLGRKSKGHKN